MLGCFFGGKTRKSHFTLEGSPWRRFGSWKSAVGGSQTLEWVGVGGKGRERGPPCLSFPGLSVQLLSESQEQWWTSQKGKPTSIPLGEVGWGRSPLPYLMHYAREMGCPPPCMPQTPGRCFWGARRSEQLWEGAGVHLSDPHLTPLLGLTAGSPDLGQSFHRFIFTSVHAASPQGCAWSTVRVTHELAAAS